MSRTARLLELLIRLRARPRFTAQELADEFGVSRRTMLRDLSALSEMGIPLLSTPGPGGGYVLARDRRLAPLELSLDEALGVLMSYEAFLRYAQSPFSEQSLSAITKLRNALPSDMVGKLDQLRRHIAVIERPRYYQAPLLGDLLRAALDRVHLRVVYDSRSGILERVIFPFGLYALGGYWYCACYDYRRCMHVSLRADRILRIVRVDGGDPPQHIPLAQWLDMVERDDGTGLALRLRVSERGMKNVDIESLFGPVSLAEGAGGVIEGTIPLSEVDWYASRLVSMGTEVVVETPRELIDAVRQWARAVIELYEYP